MTKNTYTISSRYFLGGRAMRIEHLAKTASSLGLAALLAFGGIPAVGLASAQEAWAEEATIADGGDTTAADDASGTDGGENPADPDPADPTDPTPAPDPEPTPNPDPEPEPTPELKPGWNLMDGAWYYGAESGEALTGWQKVDGKWYWLAPYEDGRMATGWAQIGSAWYYLAKSGAMQTGWQKVNGKWYFLKDSGAMATGWKKYNKAWYYLLGKTGAMATGWQKDAGSWYYLNGSGVMQTGWKKLSGKWYLLGTNGIMKTKWQKVSGKWYYLNPGTGAMRTGWLQLGKNWYCLSGSGVMHTGVQRIDGQTHIFSKTGVWEGQDKTEALFTQWAQPERSATKWLILVDTKRCKVGIFYGSKGNWKLNRMMDCAPGKSSTPTKKGRFTVGSKGYYFDSGSARCFYFTQFSGNYLFHSVLYYQNPRPTSVMDGRVGMGLSHGCVRLKLGNAKWIYDNIPRGTKVYIW